MDLIRKFVEQVIEKSDYTELDKYYLYNHVLHLVGKCEKECQEASIIDVKDALVEQAVLNQKIDDLSSSKDSLGCELMDLITPIPSVLNQRFNEMYAQDKKRAIADFYELSKANDYVKTKAIAKNIYFKTPTDYGNLEITINLSKPEKDPKQIALAKKLAPSGYPLCQLCMENEGYYGRVDHPARTNHRIVRFNLGEEVWGFQYSPYAYFNEHCIFLDGKHEPMVISKETFSNLLEIVEKFPGYFAGSNADLPIVGGSILTHEHYQGGRHVFAMEEAPVEKSFRFAGFENVSAGIVKWPMSVIRLNGSDKAELVALSAKILDSWRKYSDEKVNVKAFDGDVLHHTITPIARMKNGNYELDLVLRDNQTSEEYPDGIFHPHKDVQHIKKENIGLIEVMGLAILPPRLKDELAEVGKHILGTSNEMKEYHRVWADEIKQNHPEATAENITEIVNQETGRVFARVLEDAGVYKRNKQGQEAFMRFVENVGLE
ncbi:UDP-glucose--hexose-1-phosphate uridylyltransferase [Ligilactobacillus ruminis]|uniref:Galactose-1-phosphate uridylyltransferase n=2 Tax=Ligilactobacillus ruminis TaxID=1623 RepID=A0A6A8GSF0_9LACO|nr:UDP-glucose--hexose-1-phosphate uridylyltransferase [Ligilactobacillus ruminis]MCR5748641.1 UDP-glucose--hexose-1-phosphate uridylyltransferase [Lactobacillus sp.]KLA47099.1 galactose-1-phosphate uridylyltransferase [Ligilactobacillus ruminis]KRM82486.1 galactose-1-phosphate uridylyltransferase [Ligilactobacillus ruminis DSM 20403 = NBRC 102161]MSA19942.1 UDP-glucose--hexose-1-phosphate uridylyltransferase [Ligilactobacillus ruminis]MSA21926.1 UDP-glucose--hexose-1-phosphate uridylyltransfe